MFENNNAKLDVSELWNWNEILFKLVAHWKTATYVLGHTEMATGFSSILYNKLLNNKHNGGDNVDSCLNRSSMLWKRPYYIIKVDTPETIAELLNKIFLWLILVIITMCRISPPHGEVSNFFSVTLPIHRLYSKIMKKNIDCLWRIINIGR